MNEFVVSVILSSEQAKGKLAYSAEGHKQCKVFLRAMCSIQLIHLQSLLVSHTDSSSNFHCVNRRTTECWQSSGNSLVELGSCPLRGVHRVGWTFLAGCDYLGEDEWEPRLFV